MKEFTYNKILIFLILVGLVASLAINWTRHEVEERANTVELAIDYEELIKLSELTGVPLETVLEDAKTSGITSLAVYETTFEKLNANGKCLALTGSEIIASYEVGNVKNDYWRELLEGGEIRGSDIYIFQTDSKMFQEVREDLYRRLGASRIRELRVGSETVLEVKANFKEFQKEHLGLPTEELAAVNAAGFSIIARPTNYFRATEDDIDAVFQRLEGYAVSTMVFSGKEALGSPDAHHYTAQRLEERGIRLGMIEGVTQLQFFPQNGMLDIAKDIDYNSARLYSIAEDEMKKMKINDAVSRWSNTVPERNIRIALLRILPERDGSRSLYETNIDYFTATAEMLRTAGYELGPASPFEHFYPSPLVRLWVLLGAWAAFLLYVTLIYNKIPAKVLYTALIIGGLAFTVPLLLGHGNKIRLVAALISANFFPAIAMIALMDFARRFAPTLSTAKLIAASLVALFATGIISATGAMYLSGSLADTEYLLEVNIFRGIKLTFVLPLVLVAIAFLQRFNLFAGVDDSASFIAQFKRILDLPVKVKTLFYAGLILVAGVIMVLRSGHTSGLPVAGAEIKFRMFLEQLLWARPRSKELVIGHPAFMLMAYVWANKWPTFLLFFLVIAATIGQSSMVETFAHMRTPIYMSTLRGLGGIVLGGLLGAAAVFALSIFQKSIYPKFEKYLN